MDTKPEQIDKPQSSRVSEAGGGETAKSLVRCVLGLDSSALRHAAKDIAELETVIACDYRSARALPPPEDILELARLVEGEIYPRHQWKRQRDARFRVKRPASCCQEIALRAAPYTTGAGLGLWGFSCATREAGQGTFVIYLNTAHLGGAVAVTAAHELGHYFYHSMSSAPEHIGFAPMVANFAAHLKDEAELFSDSAAALASFSAQAASEMASRRAGSIAEQAARAHKLAQPEYRLDFASRVLSPRWRLRYLTASIHFMKLRKALRETAGV